jgi:hypothetical protein
MRPANATPAWPAGTASGVSHVAGDSAWPTRRQGKVSARSMGGSGWPDSGAGHQRGGSGAMARATRLRGELD